MATKHYQKYGGEQAVYQYIINNKPALTDETYKNAIRKYGSPDSGPHDFNTSQVFIIQFFERAFQRHKNKNY